MLNQYLNDKFEIWDTLARELFFNLENKFHILNYKQIMNSIKIFISKEHLILSEIIPSINKNSL